MLSGQFYVYHVPLRVARTKICGNGADRGRGGAARETQGREEMGEERGMMEEAEEAEAGGARGRGKKKQGNDDDQEKEEAEGGD